MAPDDDDEATLHQAPDPQADPGRAPTWGEPPDTVSTEAHTQVAERATPTRNSLTEIPSVAPPPSTGADRYTLGELIGRGGMGEVLLATDAQIGRDVAIKRLRFKPSPQGYARFLREARIQGRLDHPAIVPVHELSTDPDGRPFFAMKRLTGTTLHEILELLRDGDPFAEERYPRQRLLRAYAEVCLAVEFAHTRGVIHRDLKPANIVLGDFGEVYVLDWGVARVVADAGEGTAGAPGDLDSLGSGEPGAPGETEAGAILGTLGYIPPEQLRGEPGLDHRADVFALGCILFEILCREPLLPRGRSGLNAPFDQLDARPSARAGGRDVPPELDALCVAATRPDMAMRLGSARKLGEQLQRYLDGDRDLELRRRVAAEHLAAARAALATGDGEAERRAAMREAGRAMALDPTATDAADLASRLILEPPKTTPPEVVEALDVLDDADLRTLTRAAVIGFGVYMVFLPILALIGVRSGLGLAVIATAVCGNGALAIGMTRIKGRIRRGWVYAAILTNCVLIAVLSRLLSPFLVAPGLAATTTMAFCFYPWLRLSVMWLGMSAAVLTPWVLELAGALPRTIAVDHGSLVLTAPALELRLPHAELALAAYVVGLIGITSLIARRLGGAQRDARRTLQLQAWHLRQLMPSAR